MTRPQGWSSWLCLLAAFVVLIFCQPAEASMTVSKTASPTVATPGTVVTYTITVTNTNPSTFGPNQIDVVDTMPAFFGAPATVSITNGGVLQPAEVGTNIGGTSYRWNHAGTFYALAPATSLVITFTSTISGVAPDGAYGNNVTATDHAGPPDPTTSSGPTAVVTINNPPALSVIKSASPTAVAASGTVTYTVTATNSGASPTTGVTFVDTLPSGFAYQAGTANYNGVAVGDPTIVGQTLTWSTLGQIPANVSRVLTFQATASATIGSYNNTMTVSATNALSASTGPTAQVTVGAATPLTISKTASALNVNPGNTFTYTIQINNPAGNPVAQISSIQDLLPPNFNYGFSSQYSVNGGGFAAIADPTVTGRTLTWTAGLANIPANGNVRLTFTVYSPNLYSGSFANSATANGVNFASISTGPTASVNINGPAYAISKTVNGGATSSITVPPAVVQAYRITITNSAGVSGTPVIQDVLPTGFTYVIGSTNVRRNGTSVSVADPTGTTTRTWTPGRTITSAQTLTIDFSLNVPAGTSAGVYPDNASVTDATLTGNAPVATGDTAQTIVNAGGPNMQVSKTVSNSTVLAYQTDVYTIHVQNLVTATGSASAVTVVDTLPTGFTYQPATAQLSINGGAYAGLANPTIAGQSLTWAAGLPNPMAAGDYFDVKFTVQVGGNPGVYTNVATISGSNFTSVTTGPTATVTVGTPPAITITKSASPSVVPVPGNATTYTITVTNTGGIPGTSASISDTLPAGFTYINGSSQFNGVATGNPTGTTGTITWAGPFTIPGGGAVTLSFGANTSATPGSYNNSASTFGSNFSIASFGPGATVTVGTAPNVTISESLSLGALTVPPVGTVTVSISLSNAVGAAVANGGSLTTTLPDNVSYVLGTAQQSVNGGAFAAIANPSGTTYTITFSGLSAVAAGQINVIRFNAQVATSATTGSYFITGQTTGSNFVTATLAPNGGAAPVAPSLAVTSSSAVDLTYFRARAISSGVTLEWGTGSEWQTLGFNLYRSTTPFGPGDRVTPTAVGMTAINRSNRYDWTDTDVQPGTTYYYWLEDLEFGGGASRRGPLAIAVPAAGQPQTTMTWQPPVDPLTIDPDAPAVTTQTPAQHLKDLYEVVERTGNSLTFELHTDPAIVQTTDGKVDVVIPGLSHAWQDGQLRLPQATIPVAIPAGATYQVTIISETDDISLTAPPLLANRYLAPPPVAPLASSGPVAPPVNTRPNWLPKTDSGTALINTGSAGDDEPMPVIPAGGKVEASPSAAASATPSSRTDKDDRPSDDSRPRPTVTEKPKPAERQTVNALHDSGANGRHLQFAFGVLDAPPVIPTLSAIVGLDGQAGENRLLQLKLFPILPDGATGALVQHRTLRVKLSWDTPIPKTGPVAAPDRFAEAVGRLLEGRAGWAPQPVVPVTVSDDYQAATGPAYVVTVTRTGVQELTAAQLAAAGVSLGQPDHWQLLDHDRQVPLQVVAPGGTLAAIRFYVPVVGGRYNPDNHYILATDRPGTPLRMSLRAAAPLAGSPALPEQTATVAGAESHYYWANMPEDGASDHWFWDYVTPSHPAQLTLNALSPAPGAATLTVGLRGMGTDRKETSNNLVTVSLNGTPLGDLRWAGSTYLSKQLAVPAGVLVNGVNRIDLSMATRPGIQILAAFVDSLSLTHARTWVAGDGEHATVRTGTAATATVTGAAPGAVVLDVTDAAAPAILDQTNQSGAQVSFAVTGSADPQRFCVADAQTVQAPSLAPAPNLPDLHTAQQADYLIIAPQAFRAAADRLAQQRSNQGFQTLVVPSEAIWYEFGGGNVEPQAIHRFLHWTAYNWQKPRPTYVMLMGDGHFDYRNDYGTSPTNWLPPLLKANPLIGEIADENALVCVMGDDPLPDLFIGRLPVNSPAEADDMVTKLITSDLQTPAPWQNQAIGLADNEDPGFAAFLGQTAETYGTPRNWLRLGMNQPDALLSALDAGAGLTLYIGHGSPEAWGTEAVFDLSSVDRLQATDKPGLVVTADCLNGYFQDPDYPSIGETLLRAPHKGAMAVFATGGYTIPAAQYPLLRQFFQSTLRGNEDFGTAAAMAKLELAIEDAPLWQEELTGWLLLGDPASRLPGSQP